MMLAGASAFVAPTGRVVSHNRIASPVVQMSAGTDDFVPDMQRRTIMNLVLLGGAALPVGWMGGGLQAKDALGNSVKATEWAKKHAFPDRALVEGLKGDAHYLIVKENGSLEDYAINAVCTHLG